MQQPAREKAVELRFESGQKAVRLAFSAGDVGGSNQSYHQENSRHFEGEHKFGHELHSDRRNG